MLGLRAKPDVHLDLGWSARVQHELADALPKLVSGLERPDLIDEVVVQDNPDPHCVVTRGVAADLNVPACDRRRERHLTAVRIQVAADRCLFDHAEIIPPNLAIGTSESATLGDLAHIDTEGLANLQNAHITRTSGQLGCTQRSSENIVGELTKLKIGVFEAESSPRGVDGESRVREELYKQFIAELGGLGRVLATAKFGLAPEMIELAGIVNASPLRPSAACQKSTVVGSSRVTREGTTTTSPGSP